MLAARPQGGKVVVPAAQAPWVQSEEVQAKKLCHDNVRCKMATLYPVKLMGRRKFWSGY
jgi:hypothetical protein